MIKIFPYKMGSASARRLTEALRAADLRTVRVKPNGSYKPRAHHLIINWGNSKTPEWLVGNASFLNSIDSVALASNKLRAFRRLQEEHVPIPEFTTEPEVAANWLENGYTIVARTILNGHSGAGIHLMNQETAVTNGVTRVVPAPLYVKYMKKKHEYRVHVFNGTVIDVQQKRRRSDYTGLIDNQIRNHHTGWIYARENLEYDKALNAVAIAAVGALGLDFGAVDIIWNERQKQGYVLEVNTAPGLEGTTLQKYVNAINSFVDNW